MMGRRVLWHSFGVATTLVFVVGMDVLSDALNPTGQIPALGLGPTGGAILVILGLIGVVRYARWYRS
jgi:hypothetical protein